MAITAWSAKVSSSLICLSVKGRTSVRRIMMTPMGFPLLSKGVPSIVRQSADGASHIWEIRFCSLRTIVNVKRLPIDSLGRPAKPWLIDTESRRGYWVRDHNEPRNRRRSPSTQSQITCINASQSRAAFSTIASSTGCTSVGERLMMPSISLVAV